MGSVVKALPAKQLHAWPYQNHTRKLTIVRRTAPHADSSFLTNGFCGLQYVVTAARVKLVREGAETSDGIETLALYHTWYICTGIYIRIICTRYTDTEYVTTCFWKYSTRSFVYTLTSRLFPLSQVVHIYVYVYEVASAMMLWCVPGHSLAGALVRGRNIWVKIAVLRNSRRWLRTVQHAILAAQHFSPHEKISCASFFRRKRKKKFGVLFSTSPEAFFFFWSLFMYM